MIWINQLRLSAAQLRVAQPHRYVTKRSVAILCLAATTCGCVVSASQPRVLELKITAGDANGASYIVGAVYVSPSPLKSSDVRSVLLRTRESMAQAAFLKDPNSCFYFDATTYGFVKAITRSDGRIGIPLEHFADYGRDLELQIQGNGSVTGTLTVWGDGTERYAISGSYTYVADISPCYANFPHGA